jgi:transcriptional regulator GlxA family with amidase domain
VARVKIEEIVDHLSSEMRRALEAAVEECAPDADIDARDLFRAFKRAVGRKCSTWETVPDHYVEKG